MVHKQLKKEVMAEDREIRDSLTKIMLDPLDLESTGKLSDCVSRIYSKL